MRRDYWIHTCRWKEEKKQGNTQTYIRSWIGNGGREVELVDVGGVKLIIAAAREGGGGGVGRGE